LNFKSRLKELRKHRNITQAELAKRLNYGRTAIANYEAGRTEPSFEALNAIAEYFNVSVDYLLGRSDEQNPQRKAHYYYSHDLQITLHLIALNSNKSLDAAFERCGLERLLEEEIFIKPLSDREISIGELNRIANYFNKPLDSLLQSAIVIYDPEPDNFEELPQKFRKMIARYKALSESDDVNARRMKDTIDQLLGLTEPEDV